MVPDCVGQNVTCRVEVDSGLLVVTCGPVEVARHRLDPNDAVTLVSDHAIGWAYANRTES